jgi:release factor glutamine methyltransferase
VEECIKWLEKRPSKRRMVDVGTGSGIIAITLANSFSDLAITAIDISEKALSVARNNAKKFHLEERVIFIHNNLLADHQVKYDLIAANLPYIPQGILKDLKVSKFEPELALNGGKDGLELIHKLLVQSRTNINPGGLIILEFQYDQAQSVEKTAEIYFPNAEISILNDLAGRPRISKIQL